MSKVEHRIEILVLPCKDNNGLHEVYIKNIPDFKVIMNADEEASIHFKLDASRFFIPKIVIQ